MNDILQLRAELLRELTELTAEVDAPDDPNKVWWLDLKHQEHRVTVQWMPGGTFGLSAPLLTPGYGEGPEEVFILREKAKDRILALFREKGFTRPPKAVFLRELRAMAKLTQEELAHTIGVRQGTLSKLERKGDLTISMLRKILEAMGGKLELTASFPDETVSLLFEEQSP